MFFPPQRKAPYNVSDRLGRRFDHGGVRLEHFLPALILTVALMAAGFLLSGLENTPHPETEMRAETTYAYPNLEDAREVRNANVEELYREPHPAESV